MRAPTPRPSLTPEELHEQILATRQELDSIRALQYLSGSKRTRKWLWWIGAAVYSAALSAGGWYTREITSKLEIDSVRREATVLRAEAAARDLTIASLRRDQTVLRDALDALTQGRLVTLAEELRVIRRNYVILTAAVYATENGSRRQQKRKAADDFGRAYDNLTKQNVAPAAAEQVVLTKIAIP